MRKNNKRNEKSAPKGNIRIIGGMHRGRKLPVLMAEGLRPTTDRVKETVFNWLMPYIRDAKCLDCFAGAGSLGFEALSRGAEHVTLLELNKSAANQLSENKALLKADNLDVIKTDALVFLQTPTPPYDIAFIDPPFRKGLVTKSAELLNNGILAEKALVYVEMESEGNDQLPMNWSLLKEKVAGQVVYRLYQVN